MRYKRWELGLNRSVMFVFRTHQNSVPVPATGFRWLNKQQQLTLERYAAIPPNISLSKKGPVINKRIENPFVFERLHIFRPLERLAREAPRGR